MIFALKVVQYLYDDFRNKKKPSLIRFYARHACGRFAKFGFQHQRKDQQDGQKRELIRLKRGVYARELYRERPRWTGSRRPTGCFRPPMSLLSMRLSIMD